MDARNSRYVIMPNDRERAPNGEPISERDGKRYELDITFQVPGIGTAVIRTYDNGTWTAQLFGDVLAELDSRRKGKQ